MKKISIYKNSIVTNSAEFATQEELEQWLSYHEGLGTFGAKASSYEQQVEKAPAVIAEDGTEIVPALFETVIVEVPGYSVVIEDLTEQLEQARVNSEAAQFLAETDFKILRHVGQQALGLATSLTAQEYFELEQERQQAREAIKKL